MLRVIPLREAVSLPQSAEQFGQDLIAVHSFYLLLLESALGHEVPVPPAIAHDPGVLHRFVILMDLAVTPQMIRDGLKDAEQKDSAEALLRFFASKPQRHREDRDKVDVIASALFRIHVPKRANTVDEEEAWPEVEQFEVALEKICRDVDIPIPANEHMQLVREFHFLRQEVTDFRHFDELIDSGVMQKVRDIKQTLDGSFLHPRVLATIAAYNVFFGEHFDALFKRAASEVRHFADKVQQEGGSIMSRVDGDVIVKQLAEVDVRKILSEEYGRAQDDLRHVSKLKKAVDNRRFGKSTIPAKEAPAGAPPATRVLSTAMGGAQPIVPLGGSLQEQRTPTATTKESPEYVAPRSTAGTADREIQRMLQVQTVIRRFVKNADPAAAQVVPLPNGSVTLTPAEVEAFRVDYGTEKSFRADYAAALTQLASLDARFGDELQEFEKTRHTTYNWKPHADALAHLITVSRKIMDAALQVKKVAQQRGLNDKVAALTESADMIHSRVQGAAEALQSIKTETD